MVPASLRDVDTDVAVEKLEARAFVVPTEEPEADGTLSWSATTAVVVEVEGGGERGLGYTDGAAAAADVAERNPRSLHRTAGRARRPGSWARIAATVRNAGRPGIASTAVSAVDTALWDLNGTARSRRRFVRGRAPTSEEIGRIASRYDFRAV